MEIVGVGVENFKGFPPEGGKLIDLSSTNLIVGKNNAGKSTILEAIDLFFNGPKVDKSEVNTLAHGGNSKQDMRIGFSLKADEKFLRSIFSESEQFTRSRESLWDAIGKHLVGVPVVVSESLRGGFSGTKGPYGVQFHLSPELEAFFQSYRARTTVDSRQRFLDTGESWIKQLLSEYKALLIPFGRVVNSAASDKALELDGSNLANVVDRILATPGQEHSIVEDEFLGEVVALFPEFTGKLRLRSKLSVKGFKRIDFQEPNKISLPLEYYGSGLRSIIVQLAHLVMNPDIRAGRKMIFMVEEPELGLHPSLQRRLLNYYKEKFNSQKVKGCCILTVQSPSFIDWSGESSLARIYSEKHKSTVVQLSKADIQSTMEDIGFFQSHLLQFDVLIIVEGHTDANVLKIIIEKCGIDVDVANIGFLPLGGANIRNVDVSVLKRINPRLIVCMDSDRLSASDTVNPVAWKTKIVRECEAQSIPGVMSLDHRELENLIPVRCYREYFKDESIEFTSFDDVAPMLISHSFSKKHHPMRLAELMTREEIESMPPLKKVIDSLKSFGIGEK